MGEIFEGRWRCSSCAAENRGRVERCDGCGVSRPAGVQFYLPGNEPALKDAGLLSDAHSGRDWYCDHCDGANKNAVDGVPVSQCVNCGQARDARDQIHVVTGEAVEAAPPQQMRKQQVSDEQRADRQMKQEMVDDMRHERMRASQNYQIAKWGTIISAVMIVLAILFALLRTHTVEAEVTGKSWNRSIAIEQMQTLRRDGWSLPAGARWISSERRQNGTREVVDYYRTVTENVAVQVPQSETYNCGTRDMGNGYFQTQTCSRTTYTTRYENKSRQVPVYLTEAVFDTWYVYDEDVWRVVRKCSAAGLVDAPFWKDCPFAAPGEREGRRTQDYTLTLDLGEATAPLKVDQSDWDDIAIGMAVQVDVNRGGTPKSLAKPD
jgi:hypothetical protein